MPKILELFSGTGSVGKVGIELGYEIISVDITDKLHPVTHKVDILEWDYTIYPKDYFEIIWASPPCRCFSQLQHFNAHGKTKDQIDILIKDIGLPPLLKTEEIIEYFKPNKYFIENPQTGRMKEFINKPFYDVDYCMYSDWGYKKRTRIWTNITNFIPKICNKKCINMIDGKHNIRIGNSGGKNADRLSLSSRYRIPPKLIYDLLT